MWWNLAPLFHGFTQNCSEMSRPSFKAVLVYIPALEHSHNIANV